MLRRALVVSALVCSLTGCLAGNTFVFTKDQGEHIPFETGRFVCESSKEGGGPIHGTLSSSRTKEGGTRYFVHTEAGTEPSSLLREFLAGGQIKELTFNRLHDNIYLMQEVRRFQDVGKFVISWFLKITQDEIVLYINDKRHNLRLREKFPHDGWGDTAELMEGQEEEQRKLLTIIAREATTLFTPFVTCKRANG
jgi:hypothetical protein